MEIQDHLLETLGNTPLVRLARFFPGAATLAAKLESFNPGASSKDRIGIYLSKLNRGWLREQGLSAG